MKLIKNFFLIMFIVSMINCQSEYDKNRKFLLETGQYIFSTYNPDTNITRCYLNPEDTNSFSLSAKSKKSLNNLWLTIYHLDGHHYKIQSAKTKKFLSISNDSKTSLGFRIAFAVNSDSDSQIWIIQKYLDDKFKIINKKNFYCLSILRFRSDSCGIELKKCNNRYNEYWRIEDFNSKE